VPLLVGNESVFLDGVKTAGSMRISDGLQKLFVCIIATIAASFPTLSKKRLPPSTVGGLKPVECFPLLLRDAITTTAIIAAAVTSTPFTRPLPVVSYHCPYSPGLRGVRVSPLHTSIADNPGLSNENFPRIVKSCHKWLVCRVL
jgi:hypothetical protein